MNAQSMIIFCFLHDQLLRLYKLSRPTAEYRESKLMQCMVKFDTQSNISLGTTDDYNKKLAIRKITIIVSLSEKGSVSYY